MLTYDLWQQLYVGRDSAVGTDLQWDALNARNTERFPLFKEILVNAGFHTVATGLQAELVREVRGTLFLLWGGE